MDKNSKNQGDSFGEKLKQDFFSLPIIKGIKENYDKDQYARLIIKGFLGLLIMSCLIWLIVVIKANIQTILAVITGAVVLIIIGAMFFAKGDKVILPTAPLLPQNPLRGIFKDHANNFILDILGGFVKQFSLPDTSGKGFESITDWTDKANVYWCKLLYLRLPKAAELDNETIEQLRKIIDTELINVIKNSVYYSPEWSARLYKISESDNKVAFTILFVDCAEAEEIAKNLGEVS